MNDGKNGSDQAVIFITIVAAVVVISLISWWLGHDAIVRATFFWRKVEMWVAVPVGVAIYSILHFLHLPAPDIKPLLMWQQMVVMAPVKSVTGSDLVNLSDAVGRFLSFITIPLLSAMGVYCYFFHSSSRYVQSYNMKSLRDCEVDLWPQITPVVNLDLRSVPLEKGPWAMGQRPLDFCQQYNLVEHPAPGATTWKFLQSPAYSVFAMQMGPLFRSPKSLPIHIQALFVIFSACAQGKRKIADDLISQIAKSSKNPGRLDFSGVKEQLPQFMSDRLSSWLANRHAYVYTYMASLLEIARSDGVLASSEFLWLKTVDRRLWFMLNNVGRQTPIIEVAGPFAHWLAEKRFAKAMRVPMLQEAVNATELAIKEILYLREEDQWRNVV